MFVPFGTDAPVYHRPFATGGLILTNLVTFGLTAGGARSEGWLLTFGDGLHPLEWLTSAFLHFGVIHLLGNMVFLWSFGLIVEGKLGSWKFLLLYLGLCVLDGLIGQTLMLGYDDPGPGAGGASGVIFALMSIALIWAPKNCIDVLLILCLRTFVFDVTVLVFACFYIGMNLAFALLNGFRMSSELLHVIGAAIGFPVGILMLRRGMVDCEHWDLFSVWRGDHLRSASIEGHPLERTTASKSRKRRKVKSDETAAAHPLTSLAERLERVRALAAEGRMAAAARNYREICETSSKARLDAETLRRMIDGLCREEDWAAAEPLLEEFIDRFPDEGPRARLILASLLVKHRQRPRAALKVLDPIDVVQLPPSLRQQYDRVQTFASQLVDSGVLELQGQDWPTTR